MPTYEQIRKFRKLVNSLNDLIEEIRQVSPGAQYYLENGHDFYILSGPSHEGHGEQARQDRELTCEQLNHSDCGGW